MSYSKRKAHFSNNLETDRVEQHSHKKEYYSDYSSRLQEQKVLENEFLNILKQSKYVHSKSPRKSKRLDPRRQNLSPNFQPRELDGGVAWVIGDNPNEENSIPEFKKEFHSITSVSEDELHNYNHWTGIGVDFSGENKRLSENQQQLKNKILPAENNNRNTKPKNPNKSKMPTSRNRNRSNNRLDVRGGTNKAATLRAQSTASRSRSPSPLPHSRSQSPAISPLPGKRKDYSRGRVSQYSQYFSRKKEHENDERSRKEEALRRQRSSPIVVSKYSQYFSLKKEIDNREKEEALRIEQLSSAPKIVSQYNKYFSGMKEEPNRQQSESYYGDDSDDDDKTYVGSRRSSPPESPRKVSKSRPIRRRSAKSDDEDSELEYPRRNSRRDSVELMKRKTRNKSRDDSAGDSEGSHRSPSPPKGRRNNRRSHSRQNSTYSRRFRSESPTKSRNGSADSNKSKSSYIRSESPRYGKGWGFGGGQDSAKSTRSTRSRRASTKSNRRNASRLRREDSNESNDSRGHSGKSRYGSSRSRVGSAQSRRSFRGSRSVDSGRSRGRGGSSESRHNSDSDNETRAGSSKEKERTEAAERYKRKMSYVPPRYRKNSINPNSGNSRANSNSGDKKNLSDKTMSALSRRSIRNFDDKKYKSNNNLTPVDW